MALLLCTFAPPPPTAQLHTNKVSRDLNFLDDRVAARLIGAFVLRRVVRAADSETYNDSSCETSDRYRRALLAPAKSDRNVALYRLYVPPSDSTDSALSAETLARFVEAEERDARLAYEARKRAFKV